MTTKEDDARATPMSGMPAAGLLEESKPSTPKSDGHRAEVIGRVEKVETRLGRVEERVKGIETQVDDMDRRFSRNAAEQADALTKVASAAAKAADIALQAKQDAHSADANARTIVESGLRIHSAAIAVTVDQAVHNAMKPLADEVSKLKDVDKERSEAHRETNEAVGAIVEEFGIEDRVKLGRNVKPGDPKPQRMLAKLDRRAKSSTIVQVFLALGVIASVIERALQHH